MLAEHGITPATLAREAVTFVDVVSRGGTFEELFSLLDNWIVDFANHGRDPPTAATWYADDEGPDRGERTRAALAEAVALVRYGRGREGRRALARATAGEPALREGWLRSLVTELGR